MNIEEKKIYKRLSRQVGEAYIKYIQMGWKGKPNLFNNRLMRMKDFLSKLTGDYSNNRFMKMPFIGKSDIC